MYSVFRTLRSFFSVFKGEFIEIEKKTLSIPANGTQTQNMNSTPEKILEENPEISSKQNPATFQKKALKETPHIAPRNKPP